MVEDAVDDLSDGDATHLGLRPEDHSVFEHRYGDRLDVVRGDEVASLHRGAYPGDALEVQRGPR